MIVVSSKNKSPEGGNIGEILIRITVCGWVKRGQSVAGSFHLSAIFSRQLFDEIEKFRVKFFVTDSCFMMKCDGNAYNRMN